MWLHWVACRISPSPGNYFFSFSYLLALICVHLGSMMLICFSLACNILPLPVALVFASLDFTVTCSPPVREWLFVQSALYVINVAWDTRLLFYLRTTNKQYFEGYLVLLTAVSPVAVVDRFVYCSMRELQHTPLGVANSLFALFQIAWMITGAAFLRSECVRISFIILVHYVTDSIMIRSTKHPACFTRCWRVSCCCYCTHRLQLSWVCAWHRASAAKTHKRISVCKRGPVRTVQLPARNICG